MTRSSEKRLLQSVVAIACLVPITMGAASMIIGPSILFGIDDPPVRDLDSHFRYLSGIFFVLGLAFASCIPGIETKTARFRLLAAMVVLGGFARIWSAIEYGLPSEGHRIGLILELVVIPVLVIWQTRVARRFAVS